MKRCVAAVLVILVLLPLSACSVFEAMFIRGGERLDFDTDSGGGEYKPVEYGPVYDINGDEVLIPEGSDVPLGTKAVKSDYVSDERARFSIANTGDLSRLARVMRRCDAAFIAGEQPFSFEDESSSAGSSASPESVDDSPVYLAYIGSGAIAGQGVEFMINAYPFGIRRWWADTYGDSIKLITEGAVGTNSVHGAAIVSSRVLAQRPDVVFVDYSADDGRNAYARESFESLIRMLLEDECGCAVVIVSSALSGDESAMIDVARTYSVPVISLRAALEKEFAEHRFSAGAITAEGGGLNAYGHTILGDLMKNFFEILHRQTYRLLPETGSSLLAAPQIELPAVTQTRLTACRFVGARLYNNKNSGTPMKSYGSFNRYYLDYDALDGTGWETSKSTKPMVFNLNAQYITVMYYRTADRRGGRVAVTVDGSAVTTLECDNPDEGAADSIEYAFVYATFEKGKHTLELQMTGDKNEGSSGERVCVLGIIVS